MSELALRDEGILSRPGISHTATSLTLPPNFPYEEYEELLGFLGMFYNASRWLIADALRYGELAYEDDRYVQAALATGLSEGTLQNYHSLAGRIPPSRRRAGVSFSLHAEVAPLEPQDQERWLEAAEQNAWTKAELRSEIQFERAERNGEPLVSIAEVSIEEAARAVWHASRRMVGDTYIIDAAPMQVLREALGE